jgi:hypothetical protein
VSLNDVLGGISPNCALIAQKHAGNDVSKLNVERLDWPTAVDQRSLAVSFDQQIDQQIDQQVRQLQSLIQNAQTAAEVAHESARAANVSVRAAQDQLDQIHQSATWKIFLFVEWIDHQYQLLKKHGPFTRLLAFVKKIFFGIAGRIFRLVSAHPTLYRYTLALLHRFRLYEALRPRFNTTPTFAEEDPLLPPTEAIEAEAYKVNRQLTRMTATAQAIYSELAASKIKDEDRRS